MIRIAIAQLVLNVALAACSNPAGEPELPAPAEPVAAAPAPKPETAPVHEPQPKPAVALPEGLPALVHVWADITVTEANTLNAGENHYEIKGETRKSSAQVMNYYIRYFHEKGWEEDMIMEHEAGKTIVSFKKDGILQYVDSTEGGYGCYVTITTGNS